MTLEIFSLIDYIELILKHREYRYLNNEPFETIFIGNSGHLLISELDKCLTQERFEETIEIIQRFKHKHQDKSRIFKQILRDYEHIMNEVNQQDISSFFHQKYGLKNTDEVVALVQLRMDFIQEHQYKEIYL
ncbi:MAG: hypothetical protein ACNS62_02640 [Candidatus Cyclobacteriaceae bacterium M3_2C_046]